MSDQRTASTRIRILVIGAVLIMLTALITASVMSNAVVSISDSAEEVVRVAGHLDSPSSLRDILYSYTHQYAVVELKLQRVISYALGFLTLGLALVVGLAIAVVQQRNRIEKLEQQLLKMQESRTRR